MEIVVVAVVVVVVAVVAGLVAARRRRPPTLEELEPGPAPIVATPAEGVTAVEAPEAGPPVEVLAPVEETVAPPARPRLFDRLAKTRAAIGSYVRDVRGRDRIDDAAWEELEEALLLADVGLDTTTKLLDTARARAGEERLADADLLVDLVEAEVRKLLEERPRELRVAEGERNVWMFVGVNGVGKTTTIGKFAAQQVALGRRVLLAAADTFRAAAAEQLALWANRVGVDLVRGQEGADPGSVVFDAMAAASSRDVDLVLVDTAGRLHTKSNLMEELAKLRRIIERTEGALKEVLLVIDAATGQNGLQQARQFAEAVDITGIVLTKLDGTPKGGIVLAIEDQLGIPVKAVGVGEGIEDLVAFDPAEFAAALFEA